MDHWEKFSFQMLSSVSFVLVGLAFFGLTFWLLGSVIKIPIRKEIEEDQNTALGLVLGAVIIGISIIIAAAIHGGG